MEIDNEFNETTFDIKKYMLTRVLVRRTSAELILLRDDRQVCVVTNRDEVWSVIELYINKCSQAYDQGKLSWFDIARAERQFQNKTSTPNGKTWVEADYRSLAFQIVFITKMLVGRIVDVLRMCLRAHMVGILRESHANTVTVFGGGPMIEAAIVSLFCKITYMVNTVCYNDDPINWDRVIPFDYKRGQNVNENSLAFASFVMEHNVKLPIQAFIDRKIPLFSLERDYFPRDHDHYNLLDPVRKQDRGGVVYTTYVYDPDFWFICKPWFTMGKKCARVPDLKVDWYLDSRTHFIDESYNGPYLDMGCGDMTLTHKVAEKARIVDYYGCDLTPVNNDRWTGDVPVMAFNFVSFYMSLHHMDDEIISRALSRLNVGGKLVIRDHNWTEPTQSHLHVVHAVGAIERGENTRQWTKHYKPRYFTTRNLFDALKPYYLCLGVSVDGGPQRIETFIFRKIKVHDAFVIPRLPPDPAISTDDRSLRYIRDKLGQKVMHFDTTINYLCGVIESNLYV